MYTRISDITAMLHPSTSANLPATSTSNFVTDATKYAVADILSSFASGEPSTPTSLGILFPGATTSTADLLTPTTLANLERTFDELHNSFPITTQASIIPRESGFVPPVVEPITVRPETSASMVKQEYQHSYLYQDESSSDQDDWYPAGKRPRYEQVVMQAGYAVPQQSTPSTGGRRRKSRDINMTPEESERRSVRRERNKLAAAKCRQRRVDLTNTLLHESEGLEEEQAKLENEIQMLNQQKDQLEFLLEAHKPVCAAKVCSGDTSSSNSSVVKAERLDLSYPSVLTSSVSVGTSYTAPSFAGSSKAVCMSTSRPQSLYIPSSSVSVTRATGVAITTPSSVFNLGLDIMMDGHTGLTPITGTPSCGSQIHRNSTEGSSSSPDLSSPTTLMAL